MPIASGQVEQGILPTRWPSPGQDAERISADLRRNKWGGLVMSTNGIWPVPRGSALDKKGSLGPDHGYAPTEEPAEEVRRTPPHLG